jgi:3-phenylpropionate/trans-cinnamate dioxygenase ferredoxin component
MTRYRATSTDAVAPGQVVVVDVDERRLAIANVDGQYYAIDDVCTHDGGPLGEGCLYGNDVECPRHGARFDVRTGRVTRMPAVRPVHSYPVTVDQGSVYVDLEDEW